MFGSLFRYRSLDGFGHDVVHGRRRCGHAHIVIEWGILGAKGRGDSEGGSEYQGSLERHVGLVTVSSLVCFDLVWLFAGNVVRRNTFFEFMRGFWVAPSQKTPA